MKKYMKLAIAVIAFFAVFSLGAWTPEKATLIYGADGTVSKSRWIWTADKPVADGAVACFRQTFDLPAAVKSAVFRVKYDDSGFLWINGKALNHNKKSRWGAPVYELGKFLKPGKNTLAFQVKNGRSVAGLLFLGEIKLVNGTTVYIHSAADTKSISGPLSGKWFLPEYDDSKWGKSRALGDVLAAPWSRYFDLRTDFMTSEELNNYRKQDAKAHALPAKLSAEKFQGASICSKDGMPWFKFGSELQWPIIDLAGTISDRDSENLYYDNWVYRHGQLGIRIFQVGETEETFLRPDGKLNFSKTDRGVRRVLNLVPDAKICLYFRIAKMTDFCKKYPDEAIKFGTGPADSTDELYKRPLRPSAASLKLRQEVSRYMNGLADFVNKQPWAKRVIGIRVCYGIYSEWHSYGMYQAPDLSKPMTQTFRKYLKNKYKTVDALRKAWKDSKVAFDTAQVPTTQERRGKERFFRNPQNDAKELDFYDCYAHAHADLLIFMAKMAKDLFPGRLCGAYYGYALCNHPPEGSTVLLEKIASSPYIDFLSSPPSYDAETRLAGGSYLSRSISSTLRRYGKVLLIEDDSRFFHLLGHTVKSMTTRSPLESRMTMRRNMANMLFESCGTQFCDPLPNKGRRPGAFDDPAVDQAVKESLVMMRKALPLAEDSGNNVAVVFEPLERLRHHATIFHSKISNGEIVNAMTLPKLYRSGFVFDLMTMQDFLAAKKSYKKVIFLNVFTLSAKEREMLKAKIRKNGMTAVFFNAAGFVTPEGFSAAAVSDLTGMKIAVDNKGKDSSLKFQKSGIAGTFKRGAAERFCVMDPEAKTLGTYLSDGKTGAAVKTFANGAKSFYYGNYPLTPEQWREVFSAIGEMPLAESGSYVRHRGNLVMFHTGKKGNHTIKFPGSVRGAVELYSGKKSSGSQVTVVSEKGPATWVFKTF